MKLLSELVAELEKHWPGNFIRVLDEQGVEYTIELAEDEDDVTYLKVAKLDVPSI